MNAIHEFNDGEQLLGSSNDGPTFPDSRPDSRTSTPLFPLDARIGSSMFDSGIIDLDALFGPDPEIDISGLETADGSQPLIEIARTPASVSSLTHGEIIRVAHPIDLVKSNRVAAAIEENLLPGVTTLIDPSCVLLALGMDPASPLLQWRTPEERDAVARAAVALIKNSPEIDLAVAMRALEVLHTEHNLDSIQ